jgi:hypothetical protein
MNLLSTLTTFAQSPPPAGGAAIDQIVIATAGAIVVTGALVALGVGQRTGRWPLLGRIAAFSERVSGIPGWAALPSAIISVSLITALFGMLWDISIHIDEGRDEGPLANPAHYFILAGLFGVFAAGFIAMVLPDGKASPTSVRIYGEWYAPLGGILIAACGAFSLIGFPLDDVWHRLFGQDVTLWGPTHLMLIGGATMTLLGLAVLLAEATRARESEGKGEERNWALWVRSVALTGAFLLGLSTFQAEFDFGVPQFRFVFAPMLVAFAAAAGLVAARVWLGRGAAIGAAIFFLALRGIIALIVGEGLDQSTPYFPLYLGSAIVVELVALAVSTRNEIRYALAAGIGVGTVGLASEWAWSQVMTPISWPAELFPEGALLGFAMAIGGSLVGAWIGARLDADERPRTAGLRRAALVGACGVVLMVAFALYKPADTGISGTVAIDDAGNGRADVAVTLEPRDAADGAEWLNVTAWQGGGLVVDELERTGPGEYRTPEPVPVSGDWKTLVRLHDGDSLTALPVYLPEDPAIPAEEVAATDGASREFVADHEILQREQQTAAPALWAIAYGVVLTITALFLALAIWSVHRIAMASRHEEDEPEPRREPGAGPKPTRHRVPA